MSKEAVVEGYALSRQQKRLCELQGAEQPGTAFYVRASLRIDGPLSRERLRRALNQVVAGHEILRTTFRRLPGMVLPLQVVEPAAETVWREHDLRDLGLDDAAMVALPEEPPAGDLGRAPLLRADLAVLAPERHVLSLSLPALAADAAALRNLVRELARAYAGEDAGEDAGMDVGEPVQYIDLCEWQSQMLEGESADAGRAYWRKVTASLPAAPALFQAPETQGTFAPRAAATVLPPARWGAIQAAARGLAASPSDLLLAAWQTFLWRLAGAAAVVGVRLDGRGYEELVDALGPLSRYVPLPFDAAPDSRFADLLPGLSRTLKNHREWQDLFLWEGEGDGAAALSYPVLFDFEPAMPRLRAGDLALSLLDEEALLERFRLRLSCREWEDGLAVRLQYDPRAFDSIAAERLLGQLLALLAGLAGDPRQEIAAAPLLPEPEVQRLVREWNDTGRPLRDDACLHTLFGEQALRTPDSVALVAEEGDLSYAALAAAAGRVAGRLRALGVERGTRVAVCLERSPRMVAALLGILEAGAAYVPLDPAHPRERLAWMLEDSAAAALITDGRLRGSLPETPAALLLLDSLDTGRAGEAAPAGAGAGVTPEDPAYVIYTSGSTGRPKGVLISHRAICNRLLWMQRAFPLAAADRVAQKTSYGFDASIWELFLPLWCGARLVLAEPGGQADSAYLVRWLREQGLTVLQLVPSMLRVVLEEPDLEDCPSLARLFCGGEALSRDLRERFFARLGGSLHNLYGPTEAAIDVTCWTCDPAAGSTGSTGSSTAVPIGRPIDNVEVYVLDAGSRPVPQGAPGELHIGGAGLAFGYLRRPELTAEKFMPDPFSGRPGARLYRSGDLARQHGDGVVEVLGRIDGQIKVRGVRIELGEIEAALSRHPAVLQAVVTVRGDAPGDRRLVAYVVPTSEAAPAAAELRTFLRDSLPDAMVPSAFVKLAALPRLTSGKLDRAALPAPDTAAAAAAERATPAVAPRNAAEACLAGIWAEVLGLANVGVEDNFFELGGDSILSLQIVSRAAKAGLRFTPRQLFQHQTVAELAAVATPAATAAPADSAPAARSAFTGPVPLTPIQRLFFGRELADPHHYNQALLLEVRWPLAPSRLAGLFDRLVEQHDALRLRFERREDGWRQACGAPGAAPFGVVDLSALPAARRGGEVEAGAARAQVSLDLTRGPLARFVAFDLGGDEPGRLLLVVHHLAVDGVSWRVLLEDLALGTRQLERGEAVRLPAATASFRDWAESLEGYARQASRGELEYWLDSRRARVAPLPVDRPAGPDGNRESSGATVTVALDTGETSDLLQRAPEAYRTQINDLLLTALAQTLARWAGRRAVLFDLEGHGREPLAGDLDLSRTVGWFTAVFPVLLELPEGGGLGESLKAVKEQLRAVPGRGLGYGLWRWASGDAAASGALAAMPPAQVSFNYLGRFDQALPAASAFGPAAETCGRSQSPRQARRYLLDVNGFVSAGRLTLSWGYSRDVHERATVERLAQGFLAALRELVAHCLRPEAGGVTPSDFPLARLSQRELDRLVGGDRSVEDVYPLSPLQRGLLFHVQRGADDGEDRGSGEYFQQVSCVLEGPLDETLFARAWQQLVDRHAILRTGFAWEDLAAPVQVVRRRAELLWEARDWTRLSAEEQEAGLDAYLEEERARGFDLSRAPLMRVTLLRLAAERHGLVWSSHHLVLDGWSAPVLVRKLMIAYEALLAGRRADLGRVTPFRSYIQWLGEQDLAAAERYWRRALQGFAGPAPLRIERPQGRAAGEAGAHGQHTFEIPREAMARLQVLALEHRVTLHTLVQGVWALLLAHLSGRDDVCFGAVVAGRPAEIPGSGDMVGMFINTLPVRVRVPDGARLFPWLEELQAGQAEARQHEHSPLVDVQSWSGLPRGVALFEATFSFNNYPVGEAFGKADGGLRVGQTRWIERSSYPLDLTVGVGAVLGIRIMYDAGRFEPAAIARLARRFETLLSTVVESPGTRLGELLETLRTVDEEEEAAQRKERQASAFDRFKAVKPKSLSVARDAEECLTP